MYIKKNHFFSLFYSILIFVFSLILLPYYKYGDQTYYTYFYENCLDSGTIKLQYECMVNSVGGQEPIYLLFSKIAFNLGINKIVYISFMNSVLTYFLVLLVFDNYRKSWDVHFFICLILLNFYTLVLFFSAERLKFGFIFLSLVFLFHNKKLSWIFYLLSIFSHVQTFFALAVNFTIRFLSKKTSLSRKIIFFVAGSLILLKISSVFSSKIELYSQAVSGNSLFSNSLKSIVLILIAALSVKKTKLIFYGIPIILASVVFGGDRIVILAFFYYVMSVIYYKRKMDSLILILLLYFVIKGYFYIYNFVYFGDGFKDSFGV